MAEVLPSDELIEEPSDYGNLRPGTRLGRYELLVPIARGGMARVWAARLHGQRGFQKLVAIKTILPHLASETEFERMFLDEARIASGVHHPNVCEIYELGEESRTLYLAMEWVSGDSFARLLRSTGRLEALDPRIVSRVIADACAGLHAAHELTDDLGRQLGVVHRDLSPHNILLTSDGVAKVADFGVAKALGQLHEATSAGQLKGKINYMAPEQVTGAPIDRRSDVFAIGCVLYESTTGQRPFQGDGDHQIMHALLKGEVVPPSALVRGYPQELERIILRALAPQPILRFPTAERMRFALEEFLARGPLVTTANVAQLLRQRLGEHLERRRERIRQASTTTDGAGWGSGSGAGRTDPPPGGSMTPSGRAAAEHRSGVKPAPGRPLYETLQMNQPAPGGPPASVPFPASATTPDSVPRPADSEPATLLQASPVMGMASPYAPPPPAAGVPAPVTLAMPPVTAPMNAPMNAPPPQTLAMPPVTSPMLPDPGGMAPPFQPLSMPPASGPHSGPYSGPYPGAPPMMPPPRQASMPDAPAGAAQYAIAAGVGVLLAVLIGTGGFFAWRAKNKGATPEPLMPTAASAPASASATPAATPIALQISPPTATVVADGLPLAPDVKQIPRPAAGKSVTVLVQAPGYESATVFVDYFTKAPLVVTLKATEPAPPPPAGDAPVPSGSAAPPPPEPSNNAAPPAGDPPVAKDPPPKRPKPPKPKDDPSGVPDNPY